MTFQMLPELARPILENVEGLQAALGRQSALPVGVVRVGVNITGGRLFAQRLPSLLVDHPGLEVELVVGDHFGDMIEDRLDLAVRVGAITDVSLVMRSAGSVARGLGDGLVDLPFHH